MADKPKMNGNMKKSWTSEIVDSIYNSVAGEAQAAPKKEHNPRPLNRRKVKDFQKGFFGEDE